MIYWSYFFPETTDYPPISSTISSTKAPTKQSQTDSYQVSPKDHKRRQKTNTRLEPDFWRCFGDEVSDIGEMDYSEGIIYNIFYYLNI